MSLFDSARFRTSAASIAQLPGAGLPEIAFAGRSNAGKSTTINVLTRQGRLAFASKTPGRTQLINFFALSRKLPQSTAKNPLREDVGFLVDLPGYGYAKVSKTERDRWGKLMENYFQSAGLIHLGVQIVDARHKPTADDVTMHDYFVQTGCPVVIVANKLDKLKAREIEPNLAQIRETLSLRDDELVIPFSAEKGTGKEQLIAAILDHLND